MSHSPEVEANDEAAADDKLIQQALDPQSTLDLDRELEPGEKADDAVDFGDLSDSDLADDDEITHASKLDDDKERASEKENEDVAGVWLDKAAASPPLNEKKPEFDDLFGEGGPFQTPSLGIQKANDGDEGTATDEIAEARDISTKLQNRHMSRDQQLQQELFALSQLNQPGADGLPEPPANEEELLATLWPKFERNAVPKFMDLLPPKKARYIGMPIARPPKPTHPSKVSLELAQDAEKKFKGFSSSKLRHDDLGETPGLVRVHLEEVDSDSDESDLVLSSEDEDEDLGGYSWQDLQTLCEHWDVLSLDSQIDRSQKDLSAMRIARLEGQKSKDSPISNVIQDILRQPSVYNIYNKDPEETTSHIAKKIRLDGGDARLYWSESRHSKRRLDPSLHRTNYASAALSKRLNNRHNISNDDAYDLLKENHQHKIRGMLGNSQVEHSLPALRLQWPFYKTKLEKQEARAFHRPPLRVNRHQQVIFSKPEFVKRKTIRGKDTRSLFSVTKDLVMGDNANVLLLEYSEEYPMMLSNFGMGCKVVNHYRKLAPGDNTRPKLDLGELNVLLPQDKSPFSVFGHVDPGQTTTALHNAMYKAPLFKQEPKSSDFLIVRSTTGIGGSEWFIRGIDHLHIVGQEFPSVDIPGPHSRKVTTASKSRLKMISYRLARRNRNHSISVSDVTKHFIDTTDMQNRQKMKEFMQFDKESKEWKMKPGEAVPDEDAVRAMVKPEDVCLLESMQVGQQHLQDAGFSKDDDGSDEDDAKEGQSIEQQLSPWFATRNFLSATQGKAMLQLHGEGDPSGRGEGFSFIKTSMKGGFRAMGESIAERMDSKKMKDSGGHSYNVAKQQQAYDESIRRIWEAQKQSLSPTLEQSDSDGDSDESIDNNDPFPSAQSPRSMSFSKRRRDDETATQSTRWSSNSQNARILEISRVIRDRFGNEEVVKDIVRNPRVIRQYLRQRRAREAANEDLLDIKPGDDEEENRRKQQRLQKELARLERNKDRRIARDKQKGIFTDGGDDMDGSPSSPASASKTAGTQRKCANCGQVGHIKTNKKLCPMLNGTMKPEEGFSSSSFSMTNEI